MTKEKVVWLALILTVVVYLAVQFKTQEIKNQYWDCGCACTDVFITGKDHLCGCVNKETGEASGLLQGYGLEDWLEERGAA